MVSRVGQLYVDGQVVLSFETKLPSLRDATVTVGMDYKNKAPQR